MVCRHSRERDIRHRRKNPLHKYISETKHFSETDKLSREMLTAMVEKIIVYSNDRIDIAYKYANEFKELSAQAAQPPTAETSEISDTPKNEIPVYTGSLESAFPKGEKALYAESHKLNVECGAAIDKAISESKRDPHSYDLKAAARAVIDEYGADRVKWVVASNVQEQNFNGRYSSQSQAWAQSFDIPEKPDYRLDTPRVLIEGFIKNLRDIEKEKPSLMAAMKTAEQKSKAEFGGREQTQAGLDTHEKTIPKNHTER